MATEAQKLARKKYYEANKEKIIAKAMEKYEQKKAEGKKLVARACAECGKNFTPIKHNGERCCSDECRQERGKKAHMRWYYTDKGQETYKDYQKSDKYKTYSKLYRQRPDVQENRKEYFATWKEKQQKQVKNFMKHRHEIKSIAITIEK